MGKVRYGKKHIEVKGKNKWEVQGGGQKVLTDSKK